jgi:hypothetical protein
LGGGGGNIMWRWNSAFPSIHSQSSTLANSYLHRAYLWGKRKVKRFNPMSKGNEETFSIFFKIIAFSSKKICFKIHSKYYRVN